MKNNIGASLAADLVAQTLSGVAPKPPADAAPAAQPAEPKLAEPQPAEPPAAPAVTPPAPEGAPAWPPPPSPPPKPFDATAVTARFTGKPAEPAPAAPSAEPVSEPPIPDTPPGKQHTSAELYTWAKLRTDAAAFHRQAEEMKTAAETAKAEAKRLAEEKAQVAAEKLESDRRIADLTDKIGKLSLAESPEFKSKYDLKRAELATELSAALVKFAKVPGDKSDAEAARLLAADPATLADMVADLNPAVGGMIMAIANRVGGIDAAREQELANWRESSAASGYEAARRTVVETAETRSVYADKALELAKSYGNPVFTATDPQAKAEAEALEQAFRGFVQTASEEQLIAAAAEGFSSAQLYDAFNALSEENAQLRNQLAGRSRAALPPMFAAAPYVREQPPPAPPPNVVPATRRATPEDMARETLERSLAAFGR